MAETRRRIIDAAGRLFTEHGYGATTIGRVASEARVSRQTIYDSVGSKAALVVGVHRQLDVDANVGAIAAGARHAETGEELVTIAVAVGRRMFDVTGDLIRTVTTAAAAAPELRAIIEESTERHRDAMARLARAIEAIGRLRSDVTVEQAGSTMAALTDEVFWIRLIDDYGWSVGEVADWATHTVERAVLGPR